MKKIVSIPVLFLFLLNLTSCEKEKFTNIEQEATNTTSVTAKDSEIYAKHINNGIECGCTNNILVFPSWDVFRTMAKNLAMQREQNVMNFSNNAPKGLTDLEFEAYSDSLGFHEEQVYLDFEAAHQFASLRKMIYDQEIAWLASLGQFEAWNMEEDPDNHYIWYEERALLNEQAEVIVKDSLGNEVIYKFYEGGHVKITNNDYNVLVALNTMPGPITSENLYYGANTPNNDFEYAPEEWPNFPNDPPSEITCIGSNDIHKSFSTGSDTKIKTKDMFRHDVLFGNEKVRAVTRYYRWHDAPWPFTGGTWAPGNTTLTAGLFAEGDLRCDTTNGFAPAQNPKTKTYKAHRVPVKWWDSELNYHNPEVENNEVFGIHKRRTDVTKKIDMYDGAVQ